MDKDLFRYKLQKKIAKLNNELEEELREADIHPEIADESIAYVEAQIDAFNEVLRMLGE